MDVAVSHYRLGVPLCPSFSGPVEVQRRGEHRVVLHGVEQVSVLVQPADEGVVRRKEGMWRNDETAVSLLEPSKVTEGLNILGPVRKVQKQHVAALDRSLNTGDQDEAPLGSIWCERTDVELPIVQGDRDRIVAKRCGAVDQFKSRVRNSIDGVVGSVGMKFDLQHR